MLRGWTAVPLVCAGWVLSPSAVPVYDGIGFPDEPYRYVPARHTAAATTARTQLTVVGGVNAVGLLVNSAETGPQVSVYAPPHAFAAAGGIALRAEPLPLAPPGPVGVPDSNVYRLTLSSLAGAVTIRPEAQHPRITLRAATVTEAVMQYRSGPTTHWRALPTRKVGRDVFNAVAPGAGDYLLVRREPPAAEHERRTLLVFALALGLTVVTGALVMLRRRQVRNGPRTS